MATFAKLKRHDLKPFTKGITIVCHFRHVIPAIDVHASTSAMGLYIHGLPKVTAVDNGPAFAARAPRPMPMEPARISLVQEN